MQIKQNLFEDEEIIVIQEPIEEPQPVNPPPGKERPSKPSVDDEGE